MLHLKTETPPRWLSQVDDHLDEILIDHAHCEKKAAGTAMNLLFAYVDHEELAREMSTIVTEELDHFHQVLDLLKDRGIPFRKLAPSNYGRDLNDQVRKTEPQRAIDRLLVAGLIEARSCERFRLLAEHVQDKELADFYASLFESEARHHTTYVRLAQHYGSQSEIMERLEELSEVESEIVSRGAEVPRMHS